MNTPTKKEVLGFRPSKETLKRVEAYIAAANAAPSERTTKIDKSTFLAKAVEAMLDGEYEVYFLYFRELGPKDIARALKWLEIVERRLVGLTAAIQHASKLNDGGSDLRKIGRTFSEEREVTRRYLEALRLQTGLGKMMTAKVCREIRGKYYAHNALIPVGINSPKPSSTNNADSAGGAI